jgi:hypothetical protein
MTDMQTEQASHFEGPVTNEELMDRFQPERLSELCKDYIEDGPYGDIREKMAGRPLAIGLVDATDPRFRDIAKAVETTEFARRFEREPSEVYEHYARTDESSTFLIAIDASDPDAPRPVGALRMGVGETLGDMLDMHDLVADDFDPKINPWRQDLQDMLFQDGEEYTPEIAWDRLQQSADVDLELSNAVDVYTLAVDQEYTGQHGSSDSISIRLYHECMRWALGQEKNILLTIQDIKPLKNLQQYGDPFDFFPNLPEREYGGPFKTLPAFAFLDEAQRRIHNHNAFNGAVFVEGFGLTGDTLMIEELEPDLYSNEAVGMKTVDQIQAEFDEAA